jgi:SAM-dependent methyltransferase
MLKQMLPTARNVLVRRALRHLQMDEAKQVLVLGAGEDPYRHLFRGADRYVRVDLERRPGFTDVVADAGALPFRDAVFQCSLVTEVLEYLPEPKRFASELHRVLLPGGRAVITVPFVFHDHQDYWRPTGRALADLFREYATVSIYAQGNRLHTIFDLFTTAFSPFPVLVPFRVFSNLLFLVPSGLKLRGSHSTAPSGFLVVAGK